MYSVYLCLCVYLNPSSSCTHIRFTFLTSLLLSHMEYETLKELKWTHNPLRVSALRASSPKPLLLRRQATRGAATATCTASSARSCTSATSTSTTTETWRARSRRSWPAPRWPGWTAGCVWPRLPPCSSSPVLYWSPWRRLWWWQRGPGRGTAGRTGTPRPRIKRIADNVETAWDWRVNKLPESSS